MSKVFMKDVGSAQHIILLGEQQDQATIMVDFGIGKDMNFNSCKFNSMCCYSTCNPSQLIISHFHEDHYNGFNTLWNSGSNLPYPFRFSHIYYPKMPQLYGTNAVSPNLISFLKNVIVLSLRISLSKKLMSLHDFIRTILQQQEGVVFQPVCNGDNITSQNRNIEFLWPLNTIQGNISDADLRTIEFIKRNINQYSQEDEAIRQMNNFVDELAKLTNNFQDEFTLTDQHINDFLNKFPQLSLSAPNTNLIKAYNNVKVKDILNKWSISFRENNEILFMGDLPADPMNKVIKNLNGNYQYDILIASHHGTCCSSELKKNIKVNHCIASIGPNLMGTQKQTKAFSDYQSITSDFRNTQLYGNIII